jgi:hypothetical protein
MEPTPIAIRQRLANTTRIQRLRELDSVEEHGLVYLALSGTVSRLHSFWKLEICYQNLNVCS